MEDGAEELSSCGGAEGALGGNTGRRVGETSVHHHYHHDRSIHVQGNVGNIATGDRHTGAMSAIFSGTGQKRQEEIAEELEEWTRGMVETSAFKELMEMLNTGVTWITIKGSPGEGKTTVAKMALRELQKCGREVFQVRSPEEFNEVTKTCSRPVIMLDDILGDLEFDQTEWVRWKSVFHEVLDMKEHRSHEDDENVHEKKKVTVLLVGRDYVFNSASVHMGRLFDYMTRKQHVVDMSHSLKRHKDEKQRIWDAIVGHSGIMVPRGSIGDILDLDGGHGFPHVCRLFVTIHKENPKISARTFFQTPLAFLNETVKRFLENDYKLELFKEMIVRQGRVSERDLEARNYRVLKIAKELLGTYLRMEGGYFIFDHPSIYDSVAFSLCNYHTSFVIKNCELSFIRERIRFEPSRDNVSESVGSETDLVMFISGSYVKDLAKRFADELSKKNLRLVLSYQGCTQEIFVKEMMSELSMLSVRLSDLVNMVCSSMDMSFLFLLSSNKSPEVLKYIDHYTDIQLTQKHMNTVLYGVCRHAASSVLSYLKQSRHTLNINVKYWNSLTPLMIAVQTRDSQFVHQIMSLGPDPSVLSRGNKTALHYMCRNGLVSAVRQVIDKKVDVNVQDECGITPLFLACESKNVELVTLLIKHGAHPDRTGGNIDPPLHIATERGSKECIAVLLEAGANVNTQNSAGYTALHTAAGRGSEECVDVFLKAGADVNVQNNAGCTPLHRAAWSRSKECVYVLVAAGADVNIQSKSGYTPLHTAAWRGSKDSTDAFVEARAVVNIPDESCYTLFLTAAGSRSKECIYVLVEAGADVNIQDESGYTPLHTAAWRGSKECIDVLVETGADVNLQDESGYTPLHTAAERGHRECIDALVEAGADVNLQNKSGYTPLHTAAWRGSKECIDVFVETGAGVNVQDEFGYTPLHTAALRGFNECIDVLVEAGADVNLQNKSGYTPLHSAAGKESEECIDVLVEAGADVNIQDESGYTPLHTAAKGFKKHINTSVCQALLRLGAAVNTPDKHGNTPLHVSCYVDPVTQLCIDSSGQFSGTYKDAYRTLVTLLVDHGANVSVLNNQGKPALHGCCERLVSVIQIPSKGKLQT